MINQGLQCQNLPCYVVDIQNQQKPSSLPCVKEGGPRSGGRIVLVGTLDYIRFIRYMMQGTNTVRSYIYGQLLSNRTHFIQRTQSTVTIPLFCICKTSPFTQGRLANMYKFRVTTQDKITTNFWLTGVGANTVRPLKSVIPMGLLPYLQTIFSGFLNRTKY